MAENPWLKGCGIGCAGCLAILVLAAGVVLTLAPQAVDRVQSVIDRERWFAEWQGPEPEAPREDLFPEEVDGLRRGEVTAGPGPEVLGFQDQEFFQALYTGDERQLEVWCRPALPPVRDELFARAAVEAGRRSDGLIRQTRVGHVLSLQFGRPARRVSLWWGDDWLFVFQAQEAGDLGDFAEQLLRSIERPGARSLPLEPE